MSGIDRISAIGDAAANTALSLQPRQNYLGVDLGIIDNDVRGGAISFIRKHNNYLHSYVRGWAGVAMPNDGKPRTNIGAAAGVGFRW